MRNLQKEREEELWKSRFIGLFLYASIFPVAVIFGDTVGRIYSFIIIVIGGLYHLLKYNTF